MKWRDSLRNTFCLLPAFLVLIGTVGALSGYEPASLADDVLADDAGTSWEEAPVLDSGTYKDGSYQITLDCYDEEALDLDEELNFDYCISAVVTIQDNRIVSITDIEGIPSQYRPVYDEKNDIYISMASEGMGDMKGVVAQVLEEQTWDVDAVSGATYSSQTLMDIVWEALQEAAEGDGNES